MADEFNSNGNTVDDELEARRIRSIEDGLRAEGRSTEEAHFDDYFGFDESFKVYLPDGNSYVEHKLLNEGDRKKYQNALNRDVRIQKASGDAVLKMASGEERHQLLKTAISGWNLRKGGQAVTFNPLQVEEFLKKTNPKIIDLIEKDIRKHNAWLQSDMSIEDLDKEIATLQELRQVKVDEDEKKDSLS